ncbi:putative Glutamate decarboxylase 1 [Glarea lozoyensis 74030]|uniref:Putative Glutamate decarboxylase 1 n=1 Tax=Glarea lozoyensis (strain ATCC 74030 / MF5533) TaxID=1104152 RepID=H0EP42_GLAL7|nr:putative Glutamate decarboxylase 1 [Glarea lozoyensis 74030]
MATQSSELPIRNGPAKTDPPLNRADEVDDVGVISELLLAVLNTNVHVFQVSPALSVIEKTTSQALAQKFGFTSPHAAQMCGLGTENVISVPVDKQGRMIPEEFEKLVLKSKDEGKTPFYLNATAGTTVLGSFDPFTELSAICKKHNLWLHIDGSWGGPVIFSNDGADSEVWDLADLTLQCGRRGDSLKLALSWIYYDLTPGRRVRVREVRAGPHAA